MKPVVLVVRVSACAVLLSVQAFANSFTVAPDTSSPTISNWNWSIGIDGAAASANPALEVLTGSTYTFSITTTFIHPFWIDQAPGIGGSLAAQPYPIGSALSNNGVTTSSTITLNLPADAPDVLYYACGNHASMTGTITVIHDLVFRANFD